MSVELSSTTNWPGATKESIKSRCEDAAARFDAGDTNAVEIWLGHVREREKELGIEPVSRGGVVVTGWPYHVPLMMAAVSMKKVTEGLSPILIVHHGVEHLNTWQFLVGNGPYEADMLLVGLLCIPIFDPTVLATSDLPHGWTATRSSFGSEWQFQTQHSWAASVRSHSD